MYLVSSTQCLSLKPALQVCIKASHDILSRSLQNEASSSSTSSSSAEQAASFLTFAAADLASAVAAACQRAEHAVEDDLDDPEAAAGGKLEYAGDRMIPLASWTGTGLGPLTG